VGRNFVWTPLDPDAYKTGRIEFLEEELNQLHHEKLKNEKKAKEEFDKRLYDAKRKAISDNIELAKKSGNKLTQTMDEAGNLVGANTIKFEEREIPEGNNKR
jgi:primosomal protein N''